MRKDFKVMKALDGHTKVNPSTRLQELSTFAREVNSSERVRNELSEWQISLNPSPVKVNARRFPIGEIQIGQNIISAGERGKQQAGTTSKARY